MPVSDSLGFGRLTNMSLLFLYRMGDIIIGEDAASGGGGGFGYGDANVTGAAIGGGVFLVEGDGGGESSGGGVGVLGDLPFFAGSP